MMFRIRDELEPTLKQVEQIIASDGSQSGTTKWHQRASRVKRDCCCCCCCCCWSKIHERAVYNGHCYEAPIGPTLISNGWRYGADMGEISLPSASGID